MPHHTPLIGTIVAGLVAAFVLGAIAHRLKVSPIAGYLLAGVLVGPFTPGFVADGNLAAELAEIGVILLMFGVGLHFSLRDLLSVRKIALPGAAVQIAVATSMGMILAEVLGWGLLSGLVFGMSLSVASTVVLLRALESRNLLNTDRGRIAVGWLIVEDLATVLALVLLPAIAVAATSADDGATSIGMSFSVTLVKIVGFVAFMLIVGKRVIPWALHWVVHTGSRELFRLAVLSIALGVAFGAALVFDVSFALGAFFAGMILGETQLSRRATEETLPLRDAFAVLFFVSVGMLFDPAVLLEQPLPLLATVSIIIVGKSVAAYAIVKAFRYDNQTAITVSASLAQIGEFSFILANLGTDLNILPAAARDLILAGAIISILLHPLIFGLAAKRVRRAAEASEVEAPSEKIIVVGYGRVGKLVSRRLRSARRNFVLIDDQFDVVELARQAGVETVRGNAASREILIDAGIERASHLLIAIPEGFEAGGIAEVARKLNPGISIIARAHSAEEVQHLKDHGANRVIMGEDEIARQMIAASA